MKGTTEPVRRYCVIRGDMEVYVPHHLLTPAELTDVEERKSSALARRRFGTRLRAIRRAEDAPIKAIISVLRAKTLATGNLDPTLSEGELDVLLKGAPEHVKDLVYRTEGRRRLPNAQRGDLK